MVNQLDELTNRRGTDSVKWDALKGIYGAEDLLPLWVADMDFKVAEPIVEAIKAKLEQRIFGYPVIPESLLESITDWCKKRHNWDVEKKWISFMPGVVSALNTIVNAFTKPGEKVIIQSPVYPPFANAVVKNERVLVDNPLKFDGQHYEMDFEDLEAKIDDDVKLLILCSPHNPVGRVWKEEELRRLAEICNKHDILIASDEIHSDLILPGNEHVPLASLSPEIAERTITCIAPSKTFNLAGLQTAMTIISNKEIHKTFNEYKARQGLGFTNTLGLVATEAAYREGEAWLDEVIAYVHENLLFVKDFVAEKLPEIKLIQPEGTYLVWLDFRALGYSGQELEKFMVDKAKVALNDGYKFGFGGEGFVRMNLACPRSIVEEALQRIQQAVQEK